MGSGPRRCGAHRRSLANWRRNLCSCTLLLLLPLADLSICALHCRQRVASSSVDTSRASCPARRPPMVRAAAGMERGGRFWGALWRCWPRATPMPRQCLGAHVCACVVSPLALCSQRHKGKHSRETQGRSAGFSCSVPAHCHGWEHSIDPAHAPAGAVLSTCAAKSSSTWGARRFASCLSSIRSLASGRLPYPVSAVAAAAAAAAAAKALVWQNVRHVAACHNMVERQVLRSIP